MRGRSGHCPGIGRFLAGSIRAVRESCDLGSLHSAIKRPRCAGHQYSNQASAGSGHGDGCSLNEPDSAGNLQCPECIIAGLLYCDPAGTPAGSLSAGLASHRQRDDGGSVVQLSGLFTCGWIDVACRCCSSSRMNASPALRFLNCHRLFFTPSKIKA